MMGRLLDRITLAMVRQRLKARGICSELADGIGAALSQVGRHQQQEARQESARIAGAILRKQAIRQYEQFSADQPPQ